MSPDNPFSPPAAATEIDVVADDVDFSRLAGTRTGLMIVYCSTCTIVLGKILFVALLATGAFQIGLVVAVICFLGGPLGILIGQLFCLSVPPESGAKHLINATVALQALCIAIAVGGRWIVMMIPSGQASFADPRAQSLPIIVYANLITAFATFACFVMFLKRLATYIQRLDLSKSASTVLKLAIGVVVIYASLLALPLAGNLQVFGHQVYIFAAGVLGLPLLLMFLVCFIRYANLVTYLARSMQVADEK